MPLEFRKQRDGSLRDTWFGAFAINGKRYSVNLGVKIAGTPPASLSLRDEGDHAYERSRATALTKLEQLVEEARTQRNSANLVEKLYEIKTGEQIKSVTLAALPEEWAKIPRRHEPNARYASQCQSTLKRFATQIKEQNAKADEIAHVTRTLARAFMDAETQRGVTAKTWNDTLKLLRATFKYLLPAGAINPFSDMPTRETETVFRIPFTPEELAAISEAAKEDDFIRPILVVGMCTAMRRGDCCLLKWKDVDLTHRFITVKTAKTGVTVSIPVFPMLHDELANIRQKAEGRRQKEDSTPLPQRGEGVRTAADGYVFPEQARMYLDNPDGITWRVRKVFAAAGFRDEEAENEKSEAGSQEPEAKNGKEKEADKGAEKALETTVVPAAAMRGEIHADRKKGLRRASVRDFHSFRVTWVTLALTAGVPLELVQKVTGHKTTDIVLKHYFQPGREAFRQALHAAMPKLLTNGQKSPKDEALEIVGRLKGSKADKARLVELLGKV
ncbi:MAG: integrase [Verrucomicrobiota bacterium]